MLKVETNVADSISPTRVTGLNKHGSSSVARAFPGGQVAHPEGQNEEENEKSLRKHMKKND